MTSKRPTILSIVGPIIAIIIVGMAAGFYLWVDSQITKIVVQEGFTNWLIMIISLAASIIVALVVNFRSKISEFEVHKTLEDVTQMVKSDYDLRIERKNNIGDQLERTLQVLDMHTKKVKYNMNRWKDELNENKKKEIELELQTHWERQVQYSKNRLKNIRNTSTDVISVNMSNNLELLINSCDSKLDFDYEQNDFRLHDLQVMGILIEELLTEVRQIQQLNPESFVNNFIYKTEQVKMRDGTSQTISRIEISPQEEKLEKKSRKEIFEEYEKNYLKRLQESYEKNIE